MAERTPQRFRVSIGIAACIAVLGTASTAVAQTGGIALNRFEPAERGSYWFNGDSLDLDGDQRWSAGAVLDWSHKPLVIYDEQGNEDEPIVADQPYLHIGASLVLRDRIRVALSAPLLLYQPSSTDQVSNDVFEVRGGSTLGDLRLSSDIRLAGSPGNAAMLAAGLALHAPTGSRDAYTGDGTFRLSPRVRIAGELSPFVYSARLGVLGRFQQDGFAGEGYGSELDFGVTAGLRLANETLVVGPELYATTMLVDDAAFGRRTTVAELLFGTHFTAAHEWQLGFGMGPGLTRGFGTPEIRWLATVEWVQRQGR